MTVKIISTGKTETYNDSYAARLVEQGLAVVHAAKRAAKRSKTEVTEDVTENTDT